MVRLCRSYFGHVIRGHQSYRRTLHSVKTVHLFEGLTFRFRQTEAMLLSEGNKSGVTFSLLGFSDYPKLKIPLFLVFLAICSVTVVGNTVMIVIIKINPKLHTPIYFFLSHLSFVDFCYSSIIALKILENLVVEDRTISFLGCVVQLFLFGTFVVTESILLAVMAYDRFVAICNPLLYTVASLYTETLSNIINHFFCEFSTLLSLSCSNTYLNELWLFIISTFNEASVLLIILTSYVFIVVTILKMSCSASGCHKAFSTCASRLTAITIFHASILFLYCVPNSKNSRHTFKVASAFYTVVIPMLNSLIYSLRNKDVKNTVSKIKDIKFVFHYSISVVFVPKWK
ncbi:olfactory receptor 5D18-like [Loxodonta africana]|uniref:olfactory receptor 5D18-like n=1 Tax=Loxodonta africana TaxID=9785 RepID=UPI0030D09AF6